VLGQTAPPGASVSVSRPNAPPRNEWNISAISEEVEGKVRHARGKVELESATMLFRADDLQYNEETGDVLATGNVYFHSFERNEQLWADRVEYNTEEETGKFYNVRGETIPRIDARPGVLTSASPFYFQGEWAERLGPRYILHNGFITNCKMPSPWWTLRGPRFDIEPGERAIAYRTMFLVRKMPLFYTPFFYKSLERMPRKSGFLTPNIGNNSRRGLMFGVGYYWAFSRSYDVTYRFQDFSSRGTTHHVDLRGKPREGTDFDAVLYAVQDRGTQPNAGPTQKYGGASAYIVARSDLGNGWYGSASINYLSSFRFRQEWTESFNEAIGSEVHSVGYVEKDRSYYTMDAVFARLENFQRAEVFTNNRFITDSVVIRKLPEAEFSGRERRLFRNVPLWFSFQSAAGLLYRSEPVFQGDTLIDRFQTGQFMNRVNLEPRLTSAFHFFGIHLLPGFGIHETYYGETQTPYQNRFQVTGAGYLRSARDFSTEIVFPSLARIFPKKTVFGDSLKHVIETRAVYRYVNGIGPDYLNVIRFDENDLFSDTNELELSLTNRIYAKRGNYVAEIFSWQLWQKRYFDPTFGGALLPGRRNVIWSTEDLSAYAFLLGPRTASPVVSVMRVSPIANLGMEWRADYDRGHGGIVDSTISLDYRISKYFFSAGHNLVHNDPALSAAANQYRFRVGFGDPQHRGWNAGVDGIYDARKAVLQYATTQVTYNTDCCGISFQYRRFNIGLRNENQFRVSFSVANIGAFGTLKKQDRMF
jgi:LPS-assembly protein